ncbi:response regulator [Novosphingobium hassiacum]
MSPSETQTPFVLVVEDSVLVAMAIEDALQERGVSVAVASTLAGAIDLVAARVPAAALLDIHLPDGESLDLASRLYGAGCAIAISSAFDADAIPADFGFAVQFRKPVSPEVLAEWASGVIG